VKPTTETYLRRIKMKKTIITCICFLLASYCIVNAEDIQHEGKLKNSEQSRLVLRESVEPTCFDRYIQVLRSINRHSPTDAQIFQSIMASGRYSACDVIKIIDKYYKR
jgi:hypothetical protein